MGPLFASGKSRGVHSGILPTQYNCDRVLCKGSLSERRTIKFFWKAFAQTYVGIVMILNDSMVHSLLHVPESYAIVVASGSENELLLGIVLFIEADHCGPGRCFLVVNLDSILTGCFAPRIVGHFKKSIFLKITHTKQLENI